MLVLWVLCFSNYKHTVLNGKKMKSNTVEESLLTVITFYLEPRYFIHYIFYHNYFQILFFSCSTVRLINTFTIVFVFTTTKSEFNL